MSHLDYTLNSMQTAVQFTCGCAFCGPLASLPENLKIVFSLYLVMPIWKKEAVAKIRCRHKCVIHPSSRENWKSMCSCFAHVGPLPGTAEQNAGDQMEPPPGPDHRPLQHRLHVRGLHCQPAQTARQPGQRQDEAGGRPSQYAGPGGGLQEQVSQPCNWRALHWMGGCQNVLNVHIWATSNVPCLNELQWIKTWGKNWLGHGNSLGLLLLRCVLFQTGKKRTMELLLALTYYHHMQNPSETGAWVLCLFHFTLHSFSPWHLKHCTGMAQRNHCMPIIEDITSTKEKPTLHAQTALSAKCKWLEWCHGNRAQCHVFWAVDLEILYVVRS